MLNPSNQAYNYSSEPQGVIPSSRYRDYYDDNEDENPYIYNILENQQILCMIVV